MADELYIKQSEKLIGATILEFRQIDDTSFYGGGGLYIRFIDSKGVEQILEYEFSEGGIWVSGQL